MVVYLEYNVEVLEISSLPSGSYSLRESEAPVLPTGISAVREN